MYSLAICRNDKDPKESITAFWNEFNAKNESIRSSFVRLRSRKDNGITDQAQISHELKSLEEEITQLEDFASISYYFLPSYDARTCASTTMDMREELSAIKTLLFPPKKFSFTRKPSTNMSTEEACTSRTSIQAKTEGTQAETIPSVKKGPGIYSRSNEIIILGISELVGASDFSLSHLLNCTVYLMGTCSTLHISHVDRCKIYCYPTTGSIMVESAIDCTFSMAARQCRIHQSKGCDFYLCTSSSPIVEHCRSVRFAPYNINSSQAEILLEKNGLDQDSPCWMQVQDFDWVRSTPSPHWTLIPDSERSAVELPSKDLS